MPGSGRAASGSSDDRRERAVEVDEHRRLARGIGAERVEERPDRVHGGTLRSRGMVRRRPRIAARGVLRPRPARAAAPPRCRWRSRPEVGDRYAYRYEIEATVTRTLEGAGARGRPRRHRAGGRAGGAGAHLRRRPHPPRAHPRGRRRRGRRSRSSTGPGRSRAWSWWRASTPRCSASPAEQASVPTHLGGPPDRPLAPGDRGAIDEDGRHGSGRLERLGVIDGSDVAVVRVDGHRGPRPAPCGRAPAPPRCRGTLRSGATHELRPRRRRHPSVALVGRAGPFDAELAPPAGVVAEPVHATIDYEVAVRVTRIR